MDGLAKERNAGHTDVILHLRMTSNTRHYIRRQWVKIEKNAKTFAIHKTKSALVVSICSKHDHGTSN